MALDELPEAPVEGKVAVAQRAGPDDVLALEQRPQHRHQQRVGVEQRQRGEHRAAGLHQVRGNDHPSVGDLVGVRARGELRRAGRPAGVQVARDVARSRRRPRQRRGVRTVHPLREVGDRGRAERLQRTRLALRRGRAERQQRPRPGLARDRARVLPHDGVELGPGGHDHPRAGEADELGRVLGGEPRVDRRVDPGRLGREQQRQQLGAIDRDDRDGVAALHAQLAEHVRRAVDVGRELAERAAHRRLPSLGVGHHRRRRAVGPEPRGPGHELVRAGGKPTIGERDPLGLGEVGGVAETGPQQIFGWFGVNSHHSAVLHWSFSCHAAADVRSARIAQAGRPDCGVAIGKPVRRKRSGGGPPHWLIVRGAIDQLRGS